MRQTFLKRLQHCLFSITLLHTFLWVGANTTYAQKNICIVPFTSSHRLSGPTTHNFYQGKEQALVQYSPISYPLDSDILQFSTALPAADGLLRAQVKDSKNMNLTAQVDFSLDSHAALARNALLRKLGYAIPTPKYYQKLKVSFSNLTERDSFLDTLADSTLTSRGRWVIGGIGEVNQNKLTLTFQDVLVESKQFSEPPAHWGMLSAESIQQDPALRPLLVPLTLLSLPESVNMYSLEAVKATKTGLLFSRPNAGQFTNEITIEEIKWIAGKITELTREDWTSIIEAGKYPPDIQALIIEKTIARVTELARTLEIKMISPIPYDHALTTGTIVEGKATQESFPGYVARFSYDDPKTPLRASELVRFFGLEGISAGSDFLLKAIGQYLKIITPDKFIKEHPDHSIQNLVNHLDDHPNQAYVQQLEGWGIPILGGSIKASRNVVTGPFYGSESDVQLVDSLTTQANLGAYATTFGLLNYGGISDTPQVQYNRNYVHVRPVSNIKMAWNENWKKLLIPHFMTDLSKVLNGDDEEKAAIAIKDFLNQMQPGEMFLVTDGLSSSNVTDVGLPIAPVLGLASYFFNIGEDLMMGTQYSILARTTIYKTSEGIHVYLNRIRSDSFDLSLDSSFFVKLMSLNTGKQNSSAHSKGFIFPTKFEHPAEEKAFYRGIKAILKNNNPNIIEEEFSAYSLEHQGKGKHRKLRIGPWSWVNRENMHQLDITPPLNLPEAEKRTVIEGQVTKIKGTDIYGFFGSMVKSIIPLINIGNGARGDDPTTNLFGRSRTFSSNTEIETTASQSNKTVTKLQQSFTGWTIKKKHLLKFVKRITDELGEFEPVGGVINKEDFVASDKVQAYSVLWNFSIYENGLQKILKVLNQKATTTQDVRDILIEVMGGKTVYEQWCSQHESDNEDLFSETIGQQTTEIDCLTPSMRTVYDLRRSLQSHREIFMNDIHDTEIAKTKVKWINRAISDLEKDMDLKEFIRWVGKDQSYFQVEVSGFKARREKGESEYFSNVIESTHNPNLKGPFSDINSSSKIMMNELSAHYLSSGY